MGAVAEETPRRGAPLGRDDIAWAQRGRLVVFFHKPPPAFALEGGFELLEHSCGCTEILQLDPSRELREDLGLFFPDQSFAVAVLANSRTGSGPLARLAFEVAEPFMAKIVSP